MRGRVNFAWKDPCFAILRELSFLRSALPEQSGTYRACSLKKISPLLYRGELKNCATRAFKVPSSG